MDIWKLKNLSDYKLRKIIRQGIRSSDVYEQQDAFNALKILTHRNYEL